jgi:hypothetical protein
MNGGSVLNAVTDSLQRAARYNRDDKVQPTAVLWTDPDKLWEPLIPRLRERLPLLTLGDYDVKDRRGPGIWIRCELGNANGKSNDRPIVYLPGVERTDLRAIESCPSNLRAIAEVQFRSAWWLQSNQNAWTPASFLRSADGLGLGLARDEATRLAVRRTLLKLADANIEDLRRRGTIDADYLNSLLVSDEVKTLLNWLSNPIAARQGMAADEWSAFLAKCRSAFGLDPESAGQVIVAKALGDRLGPWARAWERFVEAPHSYPGIPDQLRKARPAVLFSAHSDSWPQDNEEAEAQLRSALVAVGNAEASEARREIQALETQHASRRISVWSQLGHAPLAAALGKVHELAELTSVLPSAGTVDDFARWYAELGWRADAAVVAAMRRVPDPASREAVGRSVRALYLPWADESARRFQNLVTASIGVGETGLDVRDGDCVVFVDGLRFDVGELLRAELSERGATAETRVRLAAFPTMTSTGKPAVAPLNCELTGGDEFEAEADGKTVDATCLRGLLAVEGVANVPSGDTGDPSGRGWTEAGDLDSTGHKLGIKIVDRIAAEVAEIASRIRELLDAGWRRVHVVTDHGWLLMPGSLPKVELAQHLTTTRKSRCARLAPGASDVQQPTIGWTWNPQVRVASGRGVAAFSAGCTYEHGGLSPQESVIPHLVVTQSGASTAAAIELVKWHGMRCRVDVVDAPAGSAVDVRREPGSAGSSLAKAPVPVEGETDVKILVQDPDSTGQSVYVVLVSDRAEILAQVETRVGGVD